MRAPPTLDLKCIADTGTFARFVPFGDKRQIIVRRGPDLGFSYGLPMGERTVVVNGTSYVLTRYLQLLSPPVLRPGEAPMSTEDARRYKPESEVLRLPEAEIYIPREPDGFIEEELRLILPATRLMLSPSEVL